MNTQTSDENEKTNPCNEKQKCKCEDNASCHLQQEIKEVILEKNLDYKDKYLRILAEMENMRKRVTKEKHETISFAIENTLCEFLPALDNFENALKFSQSSSEEVKNWALGFQMILTQFHDVIQNHGISSFHSEGTIYDPHFHEAMETVESFSHPEGTILEVYAKGYKSQQRTIRPAKVKVAKKSQVEECPVQDSENEENPDKKLNENNQVR